MSLRAGLTGASRSACVALCDNDAVIAVCEQERITRARAAGANPTGIADEALDELLTRAGRTRTDIAHYAIAEPSSALPSGANVDVVRLEHHFSHACTAYLTSPFQSAAILICDHEAPQVSVWVGRDQHVSAVEWPWHGTGLAELYSLCTRALGFQPESQEQRFEAMARLAPDTRDERTRRWFQYGEDHLVLHPTWERLVREWLDADGPSDRCLRRASVASALQTRIGELLLELMGDIRRRLQDCDAICVGGSLFYNSYLNAVAKRSGLFSQVFVPVDPGNAGLAVGAGMWSGQYRPRRLPPFLGPSFGPDEIKETLDNCKLTYDWIDDGRLLDTVVGALKNEKLVGWFDGPMEWGRRAVGARSILASPFSRFALENLNRFLKRREPWRGYGLSCMEESVGAVFDGPPAAPFMECDYRAKDRTLVKHVLPTPDAALRLHTVGHDSLPRFRSLLGAFGAETGTPLLVNTSFNGFREPIVCTPRDAIRVFFGTGLDMLVLDRFVLTK